MANYAPRAKPRNSSPTAIIDIKAKYRELNTIPEDATSAWFQSRGYQFERVLWALLTADNLDPRTGYKTSGEQIDGSFFLDGSVFLLEAKWHTDEAPASTLYQFKGKVDGKLIGTLGVFISMSGYSRDAVDALTLGKSLNLILFDKQDIDTAIEGDLGFKKILRDKLRKAAEEGIVYYPTKIEIVTKDMTNFVETENLAFDWISGNILTQAKISETISDLVVVCEGVVDREIISLLAKRILKNNLSHKSLKIIVAMGKYTIPRVANAVYGMAGQGAKVLIVTDADNDKLATFDFLKKHISSNEWIASIPNPTIETWIGLDRSILSRLPTQDKPKRIMDLVNGIDIDKLRSNDEAFDVLYTALIAP